MIFKQKTKIGKVLLIGGVGNRLFQIARAISISDSVEIIEVIEIPKIIEQAAKIFGWSYHQQWLDISKLCERINIKHRKANLYEVIYIIVKYCVKKIRFDAILFDEILEIRNLKNINIGYYQSPLHVHKEAVYKIGNQLINNLRIQMAELTVVHIRGGDFTLQTRTSGSELKNIKNDTDKVVYVTNDINYAKQLLKDKKNPIIQQTSSDLVDFITLSSARTLYPTNSTFSFWAAIIVKVSGGNVIQPIDNSMWQLLED